MGAHQVANVHDLFDRLVALVEAGQNAPRSEMIVLAFSSSMIVYDNGRLDWIHGENRDEEFVLRHCENLGRKTIIGFTVTDEI
jgi:hypothetical protein